MLEVIYLVRHGFRSAFTVDPVTGIYTTGIHSPTRIPTDPPLTSYGVEQANELADHLLKKQPAIDRVISSPYYRCLQTIDPYVAKRNNSSSQDQAKIQVEAGVSEWFGHAPWEHPAPAPLSTLRKLFPAIDGDYISQVTPPRHGETLSQLHERAATAMDRIIGCCDTEQIRSVVICTHAAMMIALGRVLTGRMPHNVDEEDFAAFTCGVSTYRRHGVSDSTSTADLPPLDPAAAPKWKDGLGVRGGWTCEANSDCSFLRGGPERGCTIGNQSLAGSGAGLGVDVEVQGPDAKAKGERPKENGSKL